jgi:phenylpyruvate tautomerase PptA (4-oxalocrotonate tautomerase family)
MGFQVILHAGVVEPELQPRLAQGIRRIYAGSFGGEPGQVAVDITEIPRGRFFSAGRPSRSSLVGGSVPAGTSHANRTRLMSEITAMWCELTSCDPTEIVVSISDAPA